jgi:hypothetical protein
MQTVLFQNLINLRDSEIPLCGRIRKLDLGYYQNFLKIQMIKEIRALKRSIVVIGMKSLKFGLSITISPGRWPSGNLLSQGQNRPASITITPIIINIRCIETLIFRFKITRNPQLINSFIGT